MMQIPYANAAVKRTRTQKRAAQSSILPDVLNPEQEQQVESYLREYMIADAAGIVDWDAPEADLDDVLLRVEQLFTTQASRKRFAHLSNVLFGRIGADVLVPHKPGILAVIGSGPEAEAHLAAAFAHRQFETVRIYARQPVAANVLAKRFKNQSERPVEIAPSPEAALHNADEIILATGAHRPIIDPDWVKSGAHITCALPQSANDHELPLELITRAKIVASDCPQYIGASADHLINASYSKRRVIHLGAMIDRFDPDRNRGTTLLFMSDAKELAVPMLKAFAHAGVCALK